jgi:Phospholipid-translocating P-type ATPase C-terminal
LNFACKRFLKDLLLVHGRWNYRRMTTVVLYSFFKNMVLVVCLFLYNFQTGFSGMPIFEASVQLDGGCCTKHVTQAARVAQTAFMLLTWTVLEVVMGEACTPQGNQPTRGGLRQ